jgi:glucan 1,3-beta-glucosidase
MPSQSEYSRAPRESPARRERRRRTHQRIDSNGDLPAPRRHRERDEDVESPRRERRRRERRHEASESENSRSQSTALSSAQLAALDQANRDAEHNEYDTYARRTPRGESERRRSTHDRETDRDQRRREEDRERRRQEHKERRRRQREEEKAAAYAGEADDLVYDRRRSRRAESEDRGRGGRRIVSGQALERGRDSQYEEKSHYRDDVRLRGGENDSDFDGEKAKKKKKWKKIIIGVGVVILILAIVIPVGVVLSGKKSSTSDEGTSSGSSTSSSNSNNPSNSNLNGISEDDIPASAKGTELDPFSWYDTYDFNVTYTDETVGGLSVMGLNATWDDSTRANDNVPPLDESFQYGTMPIRGVNLGGWLSLEPWITPSFFNSYSTRDGIVDEYTLTQKLGSTRAKSQLEEHYSKWISEQDLADIQAAGIDHVRIPYSYWAVTTYDEDPYVAKVSWRYLLRAIEWCRKHGLRVNLDLHGAPGSQNGWNHSGRQGIARWLNGTDGDLNGDRTIDVHKQVATFFSQPRYKNVVTMYGLVNEPRMVALDPDTVIAWTSKATDAVQAANFTGVIIFGDGFMGLDKWQGELQDKKNLLLDVHQYVIFNVDQIVLNHHDKINFACGGWTKQALRSQNKATGFGPTLCGEWSQADTDCTQYLNNVGVGSRWEGTLNMISTPGGSASGSVLTPTCPTKNSPQCTCEGANADPSDYSAGYKEFLLMFAEAQMHSFEQGWGWFYWTWKTESAPQWSYQAGLSAGMLPEKAYQRTFNCSSDIPAFDDLPEFY